jgi:DnaJ-class molecular chaperone
MKTIDAIRLLGLNDNFSFNDLKTAYRKLASKNHPDHGGSDEKMQLINNSYSVLLEEYSTTEQSHEISEKEINIFNDYFKFTNECIKFYFSMFKI